MFVLFLVFMLSASYVSFDYCAASYVVIVCAIILYQVYHDGFYYLSAFLQFTPTFALSC